MMTDAEVKANLAAIRERMVAALGDDKDALGVLDRVWPADWSDAPQAVVWMLGNAARFADPSPERTGLGPEFMQAWLDRLVWPNGEPKEDGLTIGTTDDYRAGLRTRLYGRARCNGWPLWIAWLLAGSRETRKRVGELRELRKAGVDV